MSFSGRRAKGRRHFQGVCNRWYPFRVAVQRKERTLAFGGLPRVPKAKPGSCAQKTLRRTAENGFSWPRAVPASATATRLSWVADDFIAIRSVAGVTRDEIKHAFLKAIVGGCCRGEVERFAATFIGRRFPAMASARQSSAFNGTADRDTCCC